jgi:hypothetical protein
MTWSDSNLVEGPVFSLPPEVGLYGSAAVDLDNDGVDEFIQVDDAEHLLVFRKDSKLLLRTSERYGGYENGFEHIIPETVQIAQQKRDFVKIKGRIELMKNPQGGLWIVVTKNIPVTYMLTRSRGYHESEVYGLSLEGAGLPGASAEFSEDWKIKAADQVTSDIQLSDVMGIGQPQVVLLLKPGLSLATLKSLFSRESELRIYRIPSGGKKHGTQ